jgi:hypothetical protein
MSKIGRYASGSVLTCLVLSDMFLLVCLGGCDGAGEVQRTPDETSDGKPEKPLQSRFPDHIEKLGILRLVDCHSDKYILGVTIQDLDLAGSAATQGLRINDVIFSVNGELLMMYTRGVSGKQLQNGLSYLLERIPSGDDFDIEVLRPASNAGVDTDAPMDRLKIRIRMP